MDIKKTVVVIVAPAVFAIIAMVATHLSGDKDSVVTMTCLGAVFGIGLVCAAWMFATKG